MKIIVFTLLFVTSLSLRGQVDCNSNRLLLESITDESTSDSEVLAKPLNLSLFSQINLGGQSSISIIYESVVGDSTRLCYSNDKKMLHDMSKRHSESKIIQNPNCENTLPVVSITIVEDKTIIHDYRYITQCNLLSTNCGTIEFDADPMINNCKEIRGNTEKEHFSNKQDLVERMDEIFEREDVIIYGLENEITKKIVRIKFTDGEGKVNSILNNEFYLGIIDEELSKSCQNPVDFKKSELELQKIGKILQKLIKNDMKNRWLKIINWSKNETGQYLINVEMPDERSILSTSNSKLISETKDYEVDLIYLTYDEIR